MKKIAYSKLEAMVGRIDSKEKARIAEEFILFECDLTEDDLDKLMKMIESKYRQLAEVEKQNSRQGDAYIYGTWRDWRHEK